MDRCGTRKAPSILRKKCPKTRRQIRRLGLPSVDLLRGFLTNETDLRIEICSKGPGTRVAVPHIAVIGGTGTSPIAFCRRFAPSSASQAQFFISAVSNYRYDASYRWKHSCHCNTQVGLAFCRRPWSSYPRVLRVGWRASVYGVHDVVMDRPSRVHIPGFPNQSSLNVDTYVRHCKL
jgi:hypothetical protein